MSNVKKWEQEDLWVEIDLELCNGSGKCAEICPEGVYDVVDGNVKADNIGECAECGSCQGECPNNAILSHSAWE